MKEHRASLTSFIVAFLVVLFGGNDQGRSKLPPGLVKLQIELLYACGLLWGPESWSVLICNPLTAYLAGLILGFVVPGMMEGLAYRKTFIERQVLLAFNDVPDCRQVLIVAAGYDTLALRMLPRDFGRSKTTKKHTATTQKGVIFLEVDHPATARVKKRGLDALGYEYHSTENAAPPPPSPRQNQPYPNRLETLAVDLTTTRLCDALLEYTQQPHSDFDPTQPTIVILEGLLFYLTEAQVIALLQAITKCVGPQSRIVCDYFAPKEEEEEDQRVQSPAVIPRMGRFTRGVLRLLHVIGEPMLWAIRPSELSHFVQQHASEWTVKEMGGPVGLEHMAVLEKKAA